MSGRGGAHEWERRTISRWMWSTSCAECPHTCEPSGRRIVRVRVRVRVRFRIRVGVSS